MSAPYKEKTLEDIENTKVRAWIKEYLETKWHETDDPVADLVRDLPAKYIVAWLVWYKDLPEEAAENVESNIRRSLCAYRFQGRLDRSPFLVALAKLLGVYQSLKHLKAPKSEVE